VTRHLRGASVLLALAISTPFAAPQSATPAAAVQAATGVFNAAEATKLLPPAVFFRGQSAPVQARNSGGVRFSKESLMLVTLVDNSGYSSQVQEKYQAYLITEAPLSIDGHRLEPGAYGVGFIAGDNFIVMDIGGHDLFTAHSAKDANLHRPSPLQVQAAPGTTDQYRLYAGRTFVTFTAAK
jgi:hypothetical protein